MAEPNHGGRVVGSNAVRQKYKIAAYVAAWILALVVTNPSGSLWTLAWMFPLGLVAILNLHLANDGGWGVLFACAAVYLVHAYFFFRSKNVLSTVLFYLVLVILLICNIDGCHRMTNTH
jgi:hypothetical protein